MELQEERDSVQLEMDEFRVATQKHMREMNKKINQGKNRHDELTKYEKYIPRFII